ncbi:hypothetical protein [Amycolatopsis nigrescens]|uniref:hypothetical protein n=1 Tax=Amycolatopsis nigrescens TaxID=381445 RepID=UPI000364DFE9|nr:hypothetical protein [Amycolatopsis nigrescens]
MPGGESFHVEPEELRGYSGLLERSTGHFTKIQQHAKDKGGDTSGFTGLLALLVPVVDGVVGLYTDALSSATEKLSKVKTNLDTAAEQYEKKDAATKAEIGKFTAPIDDVVATAPKTGGAA